MFAGAYEQRELPQVRYQHQAAEDDRTIMRLSDENRQLKRENQELQRRLDALQIRSVDVVPGSRE